MKYRIWTLLAVLMLAGAWAVHTQAAQEDSVAFTITRQENDPTALYLRITWTESTGTLGAARITTVVKRLERSDVDSLIDELNQWRWWGFTPRYSR